MGKLGGFLEIDREEKQRRPVEERIQDFKELYKPYTEEYLIKQSARCMDCGVPFCHYACPLGNLCPEWNDFVNKGEWKQALEILEATNNFPEFTGRICPAICEGGCVLGINDKPVAIENIELAIVEKGWAEGWIKPQPPKVRTGKKVAVVGSGPAGMAVAQQLNRFGHSITLFERDEKAGGILTYGIPDYKVEKWVVDRRVEQLEKEGVVFVYNTNVGVDVSVEELNEKFDAVVLAGGSKMARDLPVYGRDLKGIHYAMDYLIQANRINAGEELIEEIITAKDKNVIVIGGGDTGADCVGTAIRQGAKEIYQIELLDKPTLDRPQSNPWPNYPQVLKQNTAHEEARDCFGGECRTDVREWNIASKEFVGDDKGNVKQLKAARVEWEASKDGGRPNMKEVSGSEFALDADLVLLAIGFVHPEHDGLVNNYGLDLDPRGNVKANTKDYKTNIDKVFACGDMRKGQSLVVWAIAEGREAAESVDNFLMKK